MGDDDDEEDVLPSPPIPQYQEQLLPAHAQVDLVSDSDDEMHRGNIRYNNNNRRATSGAAVVRFQGIPESEYKHVPLVAQSRLVGDSDAICQRFKCVVGASDACDSHLPRGFVAMPCSDKLCVECYNRMVKEANEKKAPCIACPVCKRKIATSASLTGALFNEFYADLRVSCPYAGCNAVYKLGLDMHAEKRHVESCGFRPLPCTDCNKVMTATAKRAHKCPARKEKCPTCNEMVPLVDMPAHQTGELGCQGMMRCPLGCVTDKALADKIIWHKPHEVRVQAANANLRLLHARVIPRAQLEAHKAVCPSRPAVCPYFECPYQLVHHEIAAHVAKQTYAVRHLECVEKARVRDREYMEARLLQVTPHARANPFGERFSAIYNDVFKLPMAAVFDDNYHWDVPGRGEEPPHHLLVNASDDPHGVADVQRFEFEVKKNTRQADAHIAKMVVANLVLAPRRGMRAVPRRFALSVRICPLGVVGRDRNLLEGVNIDSGVYHSRFLSEFVMSGELAYHRMDLFSEDTMLAASKVPDMVTPGIKPNFNLFVELFEMPMH